MLTLLGLLALLTLVLGPIGFFLSLGVRPRIDALESSRRNPDERLFQAIADLEQRLRRVEERLAATESPPSPAAPAPASPQETPASIGDAAAAAVSAASAAASAPEPAAVVSEPIEETPIAEPVIAEPIAVEETPPTAPVHETEPALTDDAPPAPAEPETVAAAIADDRPAEQVHAPAAPPPPPEPPARLRNLEQAIGTRWTVWVGGLALALGAILLVRLSIERGVFGPPVRIALGFLLAAVLVGAGEFLRRRDTQPSGDARAAYIPGVLTATGTIAAFGTVYAAYALYHFIGPAVAFVALGAIGVACMAAAALHGPALAGLGLAGSLVTPLLVQSDDPSPWSLVVYIGVVSTTAHALSWLRNWLWLAPVAAAGAAVWAIVLLGPDAHIFYRATMVHIVVQTALAAAFMAVFPFWGVADKDAQPSRRAEIVLAAAGLLTVWALLQGSITAHFGTSWLLGTALVAAILALTAVRATPVASAIVVAGLVVLAAMLLWPPLVAVGGFRLDRIMLVLLKPDDPGRYAVLSAVGCLGIATLAASRLLRAGNLPFATAVPYAAAAALTPLIGLAIVYLRLAQGAASLPLAATALLLAATFAGGAWLFLKGRAGDANRIGLGALAASAIAAAAFALVFALDGGMLTVAFALAAVGTAFVAVRLDLAALRWCVAALGILVGARLAWDPRIVGATLSTTPIFNWLLFGYGIPAVSFLIAARVLRTRGDDTPVRVADALGLLFAAFLVFFEIRHAMNGGDPFAPGSGLLEQGLLAVASFGFGIVLVRLDASRSNVVFRFASLAAGAIGMALAVVGLGLRWNPLLTGEAIEGGTILNALLLCYLLPGLLAGLLAMFARNTRPAWYWAGAAAISLAFCIGYLMLQTRVFFHGQAIPLELGAGLAELGLDTVFCLIVAAAIAWTLDGMASSFRRGALFALGYLAALIGVLGLGFLRNPLLYPDVIAGGTIFNTLIVGYLLPALAAAVLALAVRSLAPVYGRIAGTVAAVLALAWLVLEVRVLFHGTSIAISHGAGLAELGVDTAIFMVLAIALIHAARIRHSRDLLQGAMAAGVLALIVGAWGLGIVANPLLTGAAIAGNAVFNTLLVGYGLTAALAFVLAREASRRNDLRPPPAFRVTASIAAIAALFVYVTLETRRVFQGEHIGFRLPTSEAEWYAYSAVWLVLGIALLAYGLWRRSVTVRLASALFVLASVVKVFLFDLSGLDGILRATSFIGLGLALIGIGLAYQKLVFADRGDGVDRAIAR